MIVALGQRAAAALVRINEVLETKSEITDPAKPQSLPTGGTQTLGAVKFDHVQFGYNPSFPVLSNFNLSIAAGESIAIVGATGSGKSTIARLLLRFYDTNVGHVFVDGVDVRKLRLRDLRQQIGVVFEETVLFNDSVANNIGFARPGASQQDLVRQNLPAHTTSSCNCQTGTRQLLASVGFRFPVANANELQLLERSLQTLAYWCSTTQRAQ
jgi:ATP-binding cassette subfamily B protein